MSNHWSDASPSTVYSFVYLSREKEREREIESEGSLSSKEAD